jgi:NADPH-dependent curcumin reductase CurA
MTVSMHNRKVVLRHPVDGVPRADDFRVVEEPVPRPGPGQILLRHSCLSLDPYQRPAIAGRHGGAGGPMGAGDMPPAEVIGTVLQSNHPGFSPGDDVRSFGGWQEYSLSDGSRTFRVDRERAPLSAYLGVLGMPGLTAWASVVKLANVQPGQSVLVSAAAGPVGSTAGQIAIRLGARAVGIAGSDEKCAYVTSELGFTACINYKRPDYLDRLRAAVGEGADVYHDNVGGQMLNDAMSVLRPYGTVILCGLMSQYNVPEAKREAGFNLALPVLKRAVMKGLVVYDFEDRRQEFLDTLVPWVAQGLVRYREDRAVGIEQTGAHFARLMRGENFGKALVVLE